MPYKLYSKFIIFAFTAFFLASCVSQKGSVTRKQSTEQDDIIEYGKKFLYKPYSYSGKGPHSFDCSGFTSYVFKEFGYNLNSSSAGQSQQGKTIMRKDDLQVGDLVFFEGRSHNGRVGHVGIVSELRRNGKFKFLHASTQHGVIFSSSEEPYYKARYLRGGRILKDSPKQNKKSKQQQISDTYIARNSSANSDQPKPTNEAPTISSQQTSTKLANKVTGTVAIHSRPTNSNESDVTITHETNNKPVKKSKTEDKEDKKPDSKKQNATTMSEESILPPPVRTTHVVKPGETLYSISKKYKCSVDELQAWNPKVEDNIVRAGDTLKIER